MLGAGKDDGPDIPIRFKICQAGTTDWVGWIVGARALDCPANGGLGFIPLEEVHHFSGPGVNCERSEAPGSAKPDSCYAITASSLDDPIESANVGLQGFGTCPEPYDSRGDARSGGVSLLYEGDHCVLEQGEGAWIPVAPTTRKDVAFAAASKGTTTKCVLPCSDSPVEAVPGIWDTDPSAVGTVCVVNVGELDVALSPGDKVAEICEAAVQTRVCQHCGNLDTDAWVANKEFARCDDCGAVLVGLVSDCKQCGAGQEECCVVSYACLLYTSPSPRDRG